MANDFFTVHINTEEIKQQLGLTQEFIDKTLYEQVNGLVAATRAFIVKKANEELDGWKRKYFLGDNGENIKLETPARGIWVIELDPKVEWIEEGRESVFMDWLLTKNPKAKTAKDGSRYAHIPFGNKRGAGGAKVNPDSLIERLIVDALRKSQVNLRKVERGPDGKPIHGTIQKLPVQMPGTPSQFPNLFSKPRNKAMSALTGLPEHGGIFKLAGAVVSQKPGSNSRLTNKEVTTFRTISSKHRMEGRWMYPKVEPFDSIPAAHEWAEKQWEQMIKDLEEQFNKDFS